MSRLRDWRVKALVQGALSVVPGGERINFVLLRRLTGTYPVDDAALEADRSEVRRHLDGLERYTEVSREVARCFEFGAGWDLAVPLLMAAEGVTSQTVVDIDALARDELIEDIGARVDVPVRSVADLPAVGIDYRAPVEVERTGLPSASFDLITSTNTLEHIPEADIPPLLDECRRLLAPSGICSFRIDYGDHYHYFDPSVSQFNFLRYSDRRWRWFNSSLHFQNRLRHADYLRMFDRAGFEVVEDGAWRASADQVAAIEADGVAPRWSDVPTDELAIVGSRIVLRRS